MAKNTDKFDIATIKERIDAAKQKELKPILDRIEALNKDIKELEDERAELEDIRDSIQGVSRQPQRRTGGRRGGGGSLPDLSDAEIVGAFGSKEELSRGGIMEKLGLDQNNDPLRAKVSAVLSRLVDEKKLQKSGSGRGTTYIKA